MDSKVEAALKLGKIVIDDLPDKFVLKYRWNTPEMLAIVAGCVFLDVVFVGTGSYTSAPWGLVLWLIVFQGTVNYLAFSFAANVTSIEINKDTLTLTVKNGPIPWPGNKTLSIADVQRAYAEEYPGKRGTYYAVFVILKDFNKIRLIGSMKEHHLAFFIVNLITEKVMALNHVAPRSLFDKS